MQNDETKTSTPSTARQCAVQLLHVVLDEKRPLDEALVRHPRLGALPERDRAFVRILVMTVLRRLGQIDALLARMLEKPLAGRTKDVMHCLRLGAAQIIWLKTPAHAAVHAMVETAAAMGHERMKGVVNAVLQRVCREGEAIIAVQDEAMLAVPEWLYATWISAYGEGTARAIALAQLDEPPLDLTVKQDAKGWAQKLGGVLLPTGSVRLARAGRVEALEGYAEGAWWVQDAAAQLPVRLLGTIDGLDVLDCCAAPGGKTAQLVSGGARVTAVDKSRRRLDLLTRNLERLRLKAECVESDLLRFRPGRQYDAVLLDAPCSATGTLRRHPELARNKSLEDIAELAALQKRLLSRAGSWVKPGGKLVYVVCSLQPEEGEAQAKAFLGAHPEFEVVPAPPYLKELGIGGADGALRSHPASLASHGGMDGFYAICVHRLKNS